MGMSDAFGMSLSTKDNRAAESVCHDPDALESLSNWHRAGESAHVSELVPK